MPKTWIKVHIEFLDNPKVMTLNLSLRGVWFTALGVAERYDHDGLLPPPERFALMAHTDDETAEKAYTALAKKGLLDETPDGFRIHDWQEWQASKPSDDPEAVAERVRRHRAKEREKDVTPRNALHNVTENVTPRNAGNANKSESKKREEEKEKRLPTAAVAAQRAMFGALSQSFGKPTPGAEQGRYEAAAKALITAGAAPSEIPHLHEAWGWVNPGPPRVNSLAGQLTILRQTTGPRASPANGHRPVTFEEQKQINTDAAFEEVGRVVEGINRNGLSGIRRPNEASRSVVPR